MSMGQMIEDVKLSLMDVVKKNNIHFYGMGGGWVPTPDDIEVKIKEINKLPTNK
jgi:hypothetical protein